MLHIHQMSRNALLLTASFALVLIATATAADASRTVRNSVRGAAVGAGIGALIDGGSGARTGAAAGAVAGAVARR
jgi:outer membrane lipoprotein SlyB